MNGCERNDCRAGDDSGRRGLDRRDFLRTAGLGMAVSLGVPHTLWAAFQEDGKLDIKHRVPVDKKLTSAWRKILVARDVPAPWQGDELETVGMPVGGIAAGQVYLLGDGRLGCWQIFNRQNFSGIGRENYRRREPETPVEQGFAVAVTQDGQTRVRRLDRTGFPGVRFEGDYPIGRITYQDPAFPVEVQLEAFSPFIPLDVRNSTLPATMLRFRLKNRSPEPAQVDVLGWLENAVCRPSAGEVRVDLRTRLERDEPGATHLVHEAVRPEDSPDPQPATRPPRVLADFEGDDYGDWTATGRAFGTGPAGGTLPDQQEVTGFLGRGLVNTYLDGDQSRGTLTSPPFTVDRTYLNFLLGGGGHPDRTGLELLVDDQVVRSATGKNEERLTWRTWIVRDLAGRTARVRIVDRARGNWGHTNVDQIELSDTPRIQPDAELERRFDHGTLVLAVDCDTAPPDRVQAALDAVSGFSVDLVPAGPPLRRTNLGRYAAALRTRPVRLAPGRSTDVTFVLAWHFPNLASGGFQDLKNRMYGSWFPDARAVANHVLARRDQLAADTRAWHQAFYGGSLPPWLLRRLHATVSNLATGLCYFQEDGRFWAWEGVGCCAGTCTHVWNYAHALARLFPALERSVREKQDLGAAFEESGLVRFRGESKHCRFAADGQAGTVLKCYREHQMASSDLFLERNWPRIRKALEYLIEQDGDGDGLLEGSQHNTFDINFFGANTFVGSLYLAALRAGEAMALERGDEAFAARLRAIFERGRAATVKRLWNGDYFVQDVDLKEHPKHQYGDGCLSDQLFGQGWAHQLGLGYLYPPELVQKALDAVWRYNWAPDVGPQNQAHAPQRWFARPGEAGLFTCTWPKSPHLGPDSMLYRDEVWTGIEYQVAGHMIWEGQVEHGLAIVRAIDERYHPQKRNPYNEVECGDHYARALASWGVYLALLGFEYHGPRGRLGFAPRLTPESFRAAFTAAEGFGRFEQDRSDGRQRDRIHWLRGRLRLKQLVLQVPDALRAPRVTVYATGLDRPLAQTSRWENGRLTIRLEDWCTLDAGDDLTVRVDAG